MFYTTNGDVFAGINTHHGYVPFLKEELSDAEQIYIIKGTPGSGKSTLMKRLLADAKAKGENCMAIRCSSDPDSLDGVYFCDRKAGIADGTPPHVLDIEMPVLRDKLVDIIQYCDRDILRRNSEKLKMLLAKKKEYYETAYSCLYALGVMEKAMADIAEECFDTEKIKRSALLFVKKRKFEKGVMRRLPMRCVCGKGIVSTDPENCTDILKIADSYGTSSLYLKYVCRYLEEKNAACVVIPSPVDDKTPDAVFFPAERLLLTTDRYIKDECVTVTDMLRFADREKLKNAKSRLGLYKKLSSDLLDDAVKEMASASLAHADAERIYSFAYDFGKLDAVYEDLAEKILGA